MLILTDDDSSFLRKSIADGNALLVLGAGASATSQNASGGSIKVGRSLARTFAERCGLPYNEESLVDVLSAVRGAYLSDVQIRDILVKEYLGTKPSNELRDLFNVIWKRVYTWNIDDTIENITGQAPQIRRFYNGMIDRATEFGDIKYLDIVHLHGEIHKPEHKLILTEVEYAEALKSNRHYWYQRAGQDYISACPIFIGSTLSEPILVAEIERAKREAGSVSGRGYLVTPDEMTPIQVQSLRSRGIIHIRATLAEFVDWIKNNFPSGVLPADVIQTKTNIPRSVLDSIDKSDLDAARFIFKISSVDFDSRLRSTKESEFNYKARQFLRGAPPTWPVAASSIPVELEALGPLYQGLASAVEQKDKLFIVSGQAGSGKSTAVMMSLLRYNRANPGTPIYEVSRDVNSLASALRLIRKIEPEFCIVYVSDLFPLGDGLRDDIEAIPDGAMMIVSSVRTGEWKDRFSRRIGDLVKPTRFERFVRKDYDPLIERLLKYVPAPRFRQMSRAKQHAKLNQSNSQLLIALREATESENFSDIIANEFEKLPDADTQRLFVLVGVATLSRVGISLEMARTAYNELAGSRSFQQGLDALDGIVSIGENNRLVARHDLYVRHILEDITSFEEIHTVIRAVLRNYIKYPTPIVRNVSRLDGVLFRFLLNNSVIYDLASGHSLPGSGIGIYEDFDVDFQLDGHFWLQFGLYFARLGKLDEALAMLRRSIEAYPGNSYAVHALADLQLKTAKSRNSYDAVTKQLISDAVKTLQEMDSKWTLDIDEYPIVTMANGHIGALIAHNEKAKATAEAKEYYERLRQFEKINSSEVVTATKEKMFRFATTGEWREKSTRDTSSRKNSRR